MGKITSPGNIVLMERGLWSFIAGNEEVPPETATAAVRTVFGQTIDNQQNGLETQAKVSMLLTRHP